MNRPRPTRFLVLAALLAGACGGSAEDPSPTTRAGSPATSTVSADTSESSAVSTSAAPNSSASTGAPGSSPTTAPSTTRPGPTPSASGGTTTLPGEPIDLGWPRALDRLGVIGVAHDDVLYVLAAPGEDQPEVVTLTPLATNVVATGRKRALSRSIWFELSGDAFTGWASSRYLAYIGRTTDETARITGDLGGRPTEPDMVALGRRVARSQASVEPASAVVMSAAPRVGDLGEVTYDVVGLGDDAVSGYRFKVFGSPVPGGFELRNVEATVLCTRGLTADRICT